MFSVLFEVNPAQNKYDDYLSNAKLLRPELVQIDGFVDNIRYRSLTREGWILSLSSWRDEKAVVRWRTSANHHGIQQAGRDGVLNDYHLRVGEYVADNQLPVSMELRQQRNDETVVGEGTMITLITATHAQAAPVNLDKSKFYLGRNIFRCAGLVNWDIYEAVLTPDDQILMLVWKDFRAEQHFTGEDCVDLPATHRIRHVRVIRDYAKYDRREAPQYYPDAQGRATIHR